MSSISVGPRAALRRFYILSAHVVLWTAAYFGAFFLRFDGEVPAQFVRPMVLGLGVLLCLRAGSFWVFGLFHGILRYAGIHDIKSILRASAMASSLFIGLGVLLHPISQPRSIYAGEFLLAVLFSSSLRLVVRLLRERRRSVRRSEPGKKTIVLGAGDAGDLFLRDLERVTPKELAVVAILDDDQSMHGSLVRGVRVLGAINEAMLRQISDSTGATLAVLAMPTVSGPRTREIVSLCMRLGIETKTLPSLHQIVSGHVKISNLRDVAIEDLLRREPIQLDEGSMESLLKGKRVLVTGAAGSIGSELVRQAARYEPASIALLDHNENGLFFLDREVAAAFPRLGVSCHVADIKDHRRIADILRTARPHVVLHAAAHKHVPLMEANPAEAIKNNVFGTRVVADLANAFGVETFVLISTDKAVNPTSIMGASKRVAEMYLQALSCTSRTRYVAVRFGNVLGSAGSVVPIFQQQIAAGGPVTVTDPEMMRYFMTIPEASQLVLQAGALARGGEIFLLDMGEPVRVLDLALDMIRMSGLRPEIDIPIVFSGRRPGEKLVETLLHPDEGHDRTIHPKILVGRIQPTDPVLMQAAFARLGEALDSSPEDIARAFASIVPEAALEKAAPKVTREALDVMGRLDQLGSLGFPSGPAARA